MSTQLSQTELDAILEQIRLSEEADRLGIGSEKKDGAESLHLSVSEARGTDRKRKTEKKMQMEEDILNDEAIARSLAEQLNGHVPAGLNSAGAASVVPKAIPSPEHDEAQARTLQDEALARSLAADLDRKKREEQEVADRDAKLARRLAAELNGRSVASVDETDNDEAIAKEMESHSNGGGARRNHPHLEDKNAAEDASIAEALQNLEYERAAGNGRNLLMQYNTRKKVEKFTTEVWAKKKEEIQAILNSPAVSPENFADAHQYTRTEIRAGLKYLFALENDLKLSDETQSADKILTEVLAFVEMNEEALTQLQNDNKTKAKDRLSIDNIKTTFGRIPGEYAKEASAAGETQADVHHVLSRAWDLAKKQAEQGNPSWMGEIAMHLHYTIHDKGGCIPGLIARLYTSYVQMIARELGMEPTVKRDYSKKA